MRYQHITESMAWEALARRLIPDLSQHAASGPSMRRGWYLEMEEMHRSRSIAAERRRTPCCFGRKTAFFNIISIIRARLVALPTARIPVPVERATQSILPVRRALMAMSLAASRLETSFRLMY